MAHNGTPAAVVADQSTALAGGNADSNRPQRCRITGSSAGGITRMKRAVKPRLTTCSYSQPKPSLPPKIDPTQEHSLRIVSPLSCQPGPNTYSRAAPRGLGSS